MHRRTYWEHVSLNSLTVSKHESRIFISASRMKGLDLCVMSSFRKAALVVATYLYLVTFLSTISRSGFLALKSWLVFSLSKTTLQSFEFHKSVVQIVSTSLSLCLFSRSSFFKTILQKNAALFLSVFSQGFPPYIFGQV